MTDPKAAPKPLDACAPREAERSPTINRRWLPLNALRAFEAVGRHLSFTAGAQALSVSQSALSRHVQSLEELVGCQLLQRRPHGLELTQAGQALLPAIHRSFDRLEMELNAILRQEGRQTRTLRVHMPPSFLQQVALPLLAEFRQAFSGIFIDLSSSYGTGRPSGELDIAVIFDRPQVGQTVTDLLWMIRVAPVCAPALAERWRGRSLGEFLDGNELLHVKISGQSRGLLWANYARQLGLKLETDRGLAFETGTLAVRYAMSGAGIALADLELNARELQSGELVMPFDAVAEEGYGYFLSLHAEDLADPAVALFRSWMIEHCARPRPGPAGPQAGLQP